MYVCRVTGSSFIGPINFDVLGPTLVEIRNKNKVEKSRIVKSTLLKRMKKVQDKCACWSRVADPGKIDPDPTLEKTPDPDRTLEKNRISLIFNDNNSYKI